MKVKSLAQLTSIHPTSQNIRPLGATTPEEIVLRHQERVASCDLAPDVPEDLQRSFERLRETFAYGSFCYDLFTVADNLAVLLLEQAFTTRFMTYYDGAIPLVKGTQRVTVQANTFEQVYDALHGSGPYAASGWRLNLSKPSQTMAFRASLRELFEWARREDLLHGQRNRGLEQVYLRMRNRAAHPTGYSLVMPNHAAMSIHDVAQIINRLWGHHTPGGRLYPGPIAREVVVLGWEAKTGERSIMWPAHLRDEHLTGEWTILIVKAAPDDSGLWEFDSEFEATIFPSELLWGPGTVREAIAWLNTNQPESDEVEYLDSHYLVRHAKGRPELPRRPAIFAGLTESERAGMWSLIKSDHASDAWVHMRDASQPGYSHTRGTGPCSACASEMLFTGPWDRVLSRLKSLGYDGVERPTPVRMPDPFDRVAS